MVPRLVSHWARWCCQSNANSSPIGVERHAFVYFLPLMMTGAGMNEMAAKYRDGVDPYVKMVEKGAERSSPSARSG